MESPFFRVLENLGLIGYNTESDVSAYSLPYPKTLFTLTR